MQIVWYFRNHNVLLYIMSVMLRLQIVSLKPVWRW
uniref:Uncharacterized protein n=1 Tax=Anguilla anguilla TaxID=7936 RepID=A0A0E9QTY2_ANGAN